MIMEHNIFLIGFQNLCGMTGVKIQLATACMHKKKGEMERSMLHTKGSGTITIEVYILSSSLTSSHDMIISYEAQYEKIYHANHLKVFGCLSYVHVVDQKRKKFHTKSELCIFILYSEQSKDNRLYNILANRIVASRDKLFFYYGRILSS